MKENGQNQTQLDELVTYRDLYIQEMHNRKEQDIQRFQAILEKYPVLPVNSSAVNSAVKSNKQNHSKIKFSSNTIQIWINLSIVYSHSFKVDWCKARVYKIPFLYF